MSIVFEVPVFYINGDVVFTVSGNKINTTDLHIVRRLLTFCVDGEVGITIPTLIGTHVQYVCQEREHQTWKIAPNTHSNEVVKKYSMFSQNSLAKFGPTFI